MNKNSLFKHCINQYLFINIYILSSQNICIHVCCCNLIGICLCFVFKYKKIFREEIKDGR